MGFSDEKIQQVWEKGTILQGIDPNIWRKDHCGAWINRRLHGNRDSPLGYGWEIDHIDPNGGDDVSNLRPLQWKNNLDKGEGRLDCSVASDGDHNIIEQ
jgi:hypothetical protein